MITSRLYDSKLNALNLIVLLLLLDKLAYVDLTSVRTLPIHIANRID